MRYFTLALVVSIAAGIGVLVGVVLARPSGTTLAVATQPREDQVVIQADTGHGFNQGVNWSFVGDNPPLVAIDPMDYPSGALFSVEATMSGLNSETLCIRLYDRTDNVPVSATETCQVMTTATPSQRVRSGGVQLPSAEHDYTAQIRCDIACFGNSLLIGTRIIVEWQEELVMAPVGGIGGLRGDSDAPSKAASSAPLPLPASIAIGTLLVGAGGLYAMRMRRG